MDNQIIFNIAIACAGGLALWVLNAMTRQIQKLEDNLSALKDTLPHDYVQKQDYREDIKELKDMLRQLFDKLDAKADKSAAV
jgi:RPA family protein